MIARASDPRHTLATLLAGVMALTVPAALLLSLPAQAVPPPDFFETEYVLKKGFMTIGITRRSLRRGDGEYYVLEAISRPRGVARLLLRGEIVERSIWHYHNDRARPLSYEYRNSDENAEDGTHITFDWTTATATSTSKDKVRNFHLPDDTQDKLLYQLQLMQDLAQQRENLSYSIADYRQVKTYQASATPGEQIKTPLGNFATVKIENRQDKRRTTIWAAPSLNFLPVQIMYEEKDGSRYTATLQALRTVTSSGEATLNLGTLE